VIFLDLLLNFRRVANLSDSLWFAVVANEVKELAKETGATSSEISSSFTGKPLSSRPVRAETQ
jgi:hypothetical protein